VIKLQNSKNQVFQEIEDNRLHRFLKKAINARPEYRYKLRTLALCGARNVKLKGESGGVHIISNGTHTRILGIKRCKHSWVCPTCTAREMRLHSQNIGAGIERLKQKGLIPIMITFTVFHTVQETAAEILTILKKTYEKFTRNATWKRKKADGTYYTSGGQWNQFCQEFGIKHSVKVMEVTYGYHGWHPHYHNLYWVPKNRLSEIISWEEDLKAQWRSFEDKIAKEIFSEEHYNQRKEWYTKCDARHAEKTGYTEGLYISKDASGQARGMETADYICGWGAEDELTGYDKKHSGLKTGRNQYTHYTLNEMLNEAYYHNNEKLLERYLEWSLLVITTRTHRIDYSRTGLKTLITEYKNTEAYRDCMKKKRTHIAGAIAPYHTVAYFKSEDWYEICYFDTNNPYDIPIIELIICFAKYANGYDLIKEAMEVNNLPIPLKKAPDKDYAEMFNDMLKHQWDTVAEFRSTRKERDLQIKIAAHYIISGLKSYYAKRGYTPEKGYSSNPKGGANSKLKLQIRNKKQKI